MDYGRLPGIDKPVSRLVQGTVMVDPADLSGSFALLDAVFELGCTTFDTARHYGEGNEATVGRWIRERGLRDQIVVIGKGAHHIGERKRVTPADIADDLNTSLIQFGFDQIDLYLLHRDDPTQPVGPIVEALDGHHRAGKIRAYGGSNWSHERIQEANAYAAAHGLAPFVASSPNFSLADWVQPPWADCITISGPSGAEARAWYEREQMALIPWSSLAGGFFSGRLRRDNITTLESSADRLCAAAYGSEENFQRLDRAGQLAAARGLTVPQVALAFTLSQPLNLFALVGCRTGQEFAENAKVAEIRLSPEELAWLDLRSTDPPAS